MSTPLTVLKVGVVVRRQHCWPAAPPEVGWLQSMHPHDFIVSVELPVTEHDRELEFYQVQDKLRQAFIDSVPEQSTMSCEHMAAATYDRLNYFSLPIRSISVFEDQFFGATIHYPQ